MGLFSFIKEAGEKLFGGKEVEQAAAASAPNIAELNQKAGDAIKTYIEKQNLGLSGLGVTFWPAPPPARKRPRRRAWPPATWPACPTWTTTCSTRPARHRSSTTW